MSLFITCGQGLESLLAEELNELGFSKLELGYCGVYVDDDSMASIYEINYRSRIAGRVLLPLFDFACRDKSDLYKKTLDFSWENYFKDDYTFAIDANVQHDRFQNSLFAAQVMKDAICDRLRDTLGERPSVDLKSPDIQLNLFIYEGRAIISFDTSGQPLYKRNYKIHTGAAPLQESLAAAFLRIAKYTGDEILVDPCAGSGTLLIEAAAIATHTPPGFWRREWGFFKHPHFNREDWLRVKERANSSKIPLKKGLIWGLEREPEIADFCRMNIEHAGFGEKIEVIHGNFSSHEPQAPYNFLITNPPHGKRLASEEALIPLYRSLGDFMKQKLTAPARGFIFTSSKMLSKEVGLAAKRRHVIASAGMDARLLEFDIYKASKVKT